MLNEGNKLLQVFRQICILLVFSKIFLDADLLSDFLLRELFVLANRHIYDLFVQNKRLLKLVKYPILNHSNVL